MATPKNQGELYYRRFTSKSEADKALNSLKGILVGVGLDNVINDLEVKELSLWAEKHEHLIKRNPFNEFMKAIQQLLEGDEDRVEVIKDILWLLNKCEGKSIYYDQVTADLQILHGVCHGILSDAKLTDEEIVGVYDWLEKNEHLISYYPYDEISTIVSSALADGIIEDDERIRLKAFFNDFVNVNNKTVSNIINTETKDVDVKGVCSYNIDYDFDGTAFCITGTCTNGNKDVFREKIENLGGVWKEKMSSVVDYLIVGNEGSAAYAYSCYGRKIEQAINFRKKGINVEIVHEFDFWDALEDRL